MVRTAEGIDLTVSILATVVTNGFVMESHGAVMRVRAGWRMDVGSVVVVHQGQVFLVPRALGSWVVERIKCVPRLLCQHIEPDVTWVADKIQRIMRTRQYAFGNKTYLNCTKVGKLRLRRGDEILVGVVPSEDNEELQVAVEYSLMPRHLAHALLLAMQGGDDMEPAQQWSPVTSIDQPPEPFSRGKGRDWFHLSTFP